MCIGLLISAYILGVVTSIPAMRLAKNLWNRLINIINRID